MMLGRTTDLNARKRGRQSIAASWISRACPARTPEAERQAANASVLGPPLPAALNARRQCQFYDHSHRVYKSESAGHFVQSQQPQQYQNHYQQQPQQPRPAAALAATAVAAAAAAVAAAAAAAAITQQSPPQHQTHTQGTHQPVPGRTAPRRHICTPYRQWAEEQVRSHGRGSCSRESSRPTRCNCSSRLRDTARESCRGGRTKEGSRSPRRGRQPCADGVWAAVANRCGRVERPQTAQRRTVEKLELEEALAIGGVQQRRRAAARSAAQAPAQPQPRPQLRHCPQSGLSLGSRMELGMFLRPAIQHHLPWHPAPSATSC